MNKLIKQIHLMSLSLQLFPVQGLLFRIFCFNPFLSLMFLTRSFGFSLVWSFHRLFGLPLGPLPSPSVLRTTWLSSLPITCSYHVVVTLTFFRSFHQPGRLSDCIISYSIPDCFSNHHLSNRISATYILFSSGFFID